MDRALARVPRPCSGTSIAFSPSHPFDVLPDRTQTTPIVEGKPMAAAARPIVARVPLNDSARRISRPAEAVVSRAAPARARIVSALLRALSAFAA